MPHKKHPNRPPSKDQFHGVIENYNNPRDNDAAVDAVARSIHEFGFKVPIILDANNEIVAGHTRYKAAKKLGMTEVPVIRAADLTPEQVRAFRIADNQTASLAEWNYDLLELELVALKDMEFDLSLLAFPEKELEELLHPEGKPGLTDPDDIPEPPDEAITQPGDLWILGDHVCSAATAASPRTSTVCWPAPRSNWSTPTRRTT